VNDRLLEVYGRPSGDFAGEAYIHNSVSKEGFSKDRFVVSEIDGRQVVLSAWPEDQVLAIWHGQHQLELRFRGSRGKMRSRPVEAVVALEANFTTNKDYRVRGEVEGDSAFLWLEESDSGKLVTEKKSAPVKDYSEFNPLLPPRG
jgi:hypothetical protein